MEQTNQFDAKRIALIKEKLEKFTPSLLRDFSSWMGSVCKDSLTTTTVTATTVLSAVGTAFLSNPDTPLLTTAIATPAAYLTAKYAGVIAGAIAERQDTKLAKELLLEAKEQSSTKDILLLRRIAELQPDNLLVNDYLASGKCLDDFLANRKEHYNVAWREDENLLREGEVLRYIQNEFDLAKQVLETNKPLDAYLIDRMERRTKNSTILSLNDESTAKDFHLGLKLK